MGRCRCTCGCPKLRGFKNPFRVEYQVVNLDKLSALYPEGGDVTVDDLVAKGAVRKGQPVKVLGTGELTVKVSRRGRRVLGVREGRRSWLPAGASRRTDRRTGPVGRSYPPAPFRMSAGIS